MDHPIIVFSCVLTGYLLGSVMAAYPVCRLFGLANPTESGSGNPGATNIYRLGGPWPASLTLLWDAGKGAFAVSLAMQLTDSEQLLILTAMASVLGHILPAFHRFRGGKGVATAMGATLVVAPATTALLIVIWAALMAWKRLSSLASLTAAAMAPWLAWWLDPGAVTLFLVLSIFLFVRHRENIVRMIRQQELRVRYRSRQAPQEKTAPTGDEQE